MTWLTCTCIQTSFLLHAHNELVPGPLPTYRLRCSLYANGIVRGRNLLNISDAIGRAIVSFNWAIVFFQSGDLKYSFYCIVYTAFVKMYHNSTHLKKFYYFKAIISYRQLFLFLHGLHCSAVFFLKCIVVRTREKFLGLEE